MSSIVRPDGQPVRPQVDAGQIMRILNHLNGKIDLANQQVMNLSLMLDFIIEKLETAGITLPLNEFPEWADHQMKLHREEMEKMMQQRLTPTEKSPINLEDDA